MKNKLTRLIVALSVLALPALVQAQLSFVTNSGAITITGYNIAGGPNVVIPATTNGYPVTSIGQNALIEDTNITNVTIPNTVTNIGIGAFEHCPGLASVTIPYGVASIGGDAFYADKSLASVNIPGSVTSIGDGAFAGTGITSVTVPASVTSIGLKAFWECSSLTSINVNTANTNYSSLNGVLFNQAQTTLIEYPGGLFGSYSIPYGVTSIGDAAFYGSLIASVIFPNGVTNIGDAAFDYCESLTSVNIGNSVTSIGGSAFYQCIQLTSVNIPASVTTIGDFAFEYSGLTSLSIPYGVNSIGNYAFANLGLTSVSIPATVTNLGGALPGGLAFYGCTSLTSINVDLANPAYSSPGGVLFDHSGVTLIEFPGGLVGSYAISYGVTSIGQAAFYGDISLTSVSIPASVTSIGQDAFANCTSLTSAYFQGNAPPDEGNAFTGYPTYDPAIVYYLPGTSGWGSTFGGVPAVMLSPFTYTTSGGNVTITGYNPSFGLAVVIPATINGNPVTSIGPSAFAGTGITSVTIPAGVTSIGQQAFAYCTNLTSVIIPSGVITIGDDAFYDNTSLTTVTIPASVTSLGSAAFYNCTHLTSAYFLGNAPSNDGSAFAGFPTYDPATAYYLAGTAGWGSMYGGIPTALWNPFTYTTSGGDITITGYNPAAGLNVVIPATINGDPVTGIAPDTFYGDTSITSVSIPAGVTSIGAEAFADCTSLTAITVDPANPDFSSLGGVLFDKSQATLIAYPGGLGGSYTIPGTVTSIGDEAFYGAASLTSVTNPASITNIGHEAFYDCTSLTSAYFLGNAPASDGTAFTASSAYDPTTVYFLGGTTGWGSLYGGVPAVLLSPFTYTISGGAATITGYTGGGGNVVIPATIDGYPVTSIGNSAFYNKATITTLTIPNSVTSIGIEAVDDCSGLTTLTIPASVTTIGDYAFYNDTSLTSVNFSGNAPPDDGTIFYQDPATVYYLPGTTGWGSTFGTVPAVLWNPQAHMFSLAGGQFGFNLTGPANATIEVDACTNLSHPVWQTVATQTLSALGTSAFTDTQFSAYPIRFYRFRSP